MTVRLAAGPYDNSCSALSFLFVECDMDQNSTEVSKNVWLCGIRLDCIRRVVAVLLQDRGRLLVYARQRGRIQCPLLHSFCEILHNSKDPEHVAALFFLLFDWNLILHADNVVNTHVDLFGIMNDA